MDIVKGSVVRAKAGRDKDKFFVVLQTDGEYALIADGKRRRVEHPKRKKLKRGFERKRDALEWERKFLLQKSADLNMTFGAFVEIYYADKQDRIREHTWIAKRNIIETKILPYFKDRVISEIEPRDIIAWQNTMMKQRKADGKPYAPGYLKTIHAEISSIFNHAVRYYRLQSNPAAVAGNMGHESHQEMLFWTKEEYLKFAAEMMDKPAMYYAFEVLYWCGVRLGEMLALTPEDFDFEKQTLRINKSYQRLNGKDVVTEPKTPKSIRTIRMNKALADEMQDYIRSFYHIGPRDRIFTMSDSALHHQMEQGAKRAGVKKIRIHDLRHSHVSLLINMGFSAVAIADRVGHESIDITYRYAHLFPDKQGEMADRLDDEWTGKEGA